MQTIDKIGSRFAPWLPLANILSGVLVLVFAIPASLVLLPLFTLGAFLSPYSVFRGIFALFFGVVSGILLLISGILLQKKSLKGWKLAIIATLLGVIYSLRNLSILGLLWDVFILFVLLRFRSFYQVPEGVDMFRLVGLMDNLIHSSQQPGPAPTPKQPQAQPPQPQAPSSAQTPPATRTTTQQAPPGQQTQSTTPSSPPTPAKNSQP